ncbi:MAG: TetR/AcrR family transcriptional regulator [Bacteroidales bacterium]|jgi:AcrR family transcriptional regulator|nr:TetR/AcrR family transcriptional regulator [Bacteroidales bacterium]
MDIKERIKLKASELFCQYGIKSVSMDELASELGISKRTIYENFKDKEEILLSVLHMIKEKRRDSFSSLITDTSNVVEVFIAIIEIHQNSPMCSGRFFDDIHKYYPKAAKLIKEENEKNNSELRIFLNNGIEQGYIRGDLNVEVTAFLVEESTFTYIRASLLERPGFSYRELFYTMMINFVRGISTAKGIKIIDEYLEKKKQS